MSPTFKLRGGKFTFTPLDGPIDQEPRSPLFDEIGHAILACARLEFLVTALVMHVNKEGASKALHDPDPWATHKALLKLLFKWLREHPEYATLAPMHDEKFYDALLADADLRNEFAHSFLESIDANGALSIGAQSGPT